MKTCTDCVYWRKEEQGPEDFKARCGVTCPPLYTSADTPACQDFATEDPFVEAVIRA